MQHAYDVIIVGGGAIGCTIAWRLGQTGRKVLLLEKGQLGAEASSAAAGMLGAQLETKEPGPFYQLCLQSRALYPSFAAELYEQTGIDIQYTANGILHIASTQAEVKQLQARMGWQVAHGGSAEWLSAADVHAVEPPLAACYGGLYLPDDGNVLAPLVARATAAAAKKYATVVEGAEVYSIDPMNGSVHVKTATDTYIGEHVVVAAGAWADSVLQNSGSHFGIAPVKGQLFSIRPRTHTSLNKTIFTEGVYLVPKRDGSIVVGATEEHGAGFNRSITIDGLHALMTAVQSVTPGLANAEFERAWIGLRPKSSTGMPAIGCLPLQPNIHVAVGHFRNGILLTPVTANMMVAEMEGKEPSETWAAFSPKTSNVQEGA